MSVIFALGAVKVELTKNHSTVAPVRRCFQIFSTSSPNVITMSEKNITICDHRSEKDIEIRKRKSSIPQAASENILAAILRRSVSKISSREVFCLLTDGQQPRSAAVV